MTSADALHLAVALDGAGWHPAAWREPDARPGELFTARYWTDLVQTAERGLVDFVTLEDGLSLQSSRYGEPDDRTDRVRGRLDAVHVAARVAPRTLNVGLVPTVTVTHTEPFHVSKAIATLDYVSSGRAGWRVLVSARHNEARHFGRRQFPTFDFADRDQPRASTLVADLFDEAADYVEVVRRLWDSWEDDAEIRDAATGRFIDRDKLHYVDFVGRWFRVRGPSIVPRPPQGQPLVTALAHDVVPYRLAARSADVVYVTPRDTSHAVKIVARVREAEATAEAEGAEGAEAAEAAKVATVAKVAKAATGRAGGAPLHVFGDLVVFLDAARARAAQRRARLDEVAGSPYRSDALIFAGTPAELADLLEDWQAAGLTGFRLRPAALPHDLTAITEGLVPELQRRGVFRTSYEAATLRGLLGLSRPASRYASSP